MAYCSMYPAAHVNCHVTHTTENKTPCLELTNYDLLNQLLDIYVAVRLLNFCRREPAAQSQPLQPHGQTSMLS